MKEHYKQVSMRLGHGGYREGAGRKKKNDNKIVKAVKLKLTEEEWKTIEFLMRFEQKSKSELVSDLLSQILKIK